MNNLFYGLKFRNCNNWKADPYTIKINNHALSMVASRINNELPIAFPDIKYHDIIDGLAYICAYTMVPYGKEGLQYVKEKIYPKTIEEFMKEKATELLKTVEIYDNEENRELYAAMEEYCQIYDKSTVTYNLAGVALLLTYLSSEEIKVQFKPTSTYGNYKEEKEYSKKHSEYILHYFNILNNIGKTHPDNLNPGELLSQMLNKLPYYHDFVFTDTHRQDIDKLPLFTGYEK